MIKYSLLLIIIIFCLPACSSTKYTYREIQKDKANYNEQSFNVTSSMLQKALVASLLSKKFVIDVDDQVNMLVSARRFFNKGRNSIVVVVQGKIMSIDGKTQRLFLNGIQTSERSYVADRTRFLLWVIPLPGGGGKVVSNAKESELAIEDKTFYEDIFSAVKQNLII